MVLVQHQKKAGVFRKIVICIATVLCALFVQQPQRPFEDYLGLLDNSEIKQVIQRDIPTTNAATADGDIQKTSLLLQKATPIQQSLNLNASKQNLAIQIPQPSSVSLDRQNNSSLAILPSHRPDHKMPQWMLEYFQWHQQQRAQLTAQNWNKGRFKFLIMRCLHSEICGGTSDRLQSLPYQLLMAHQQKRILLIYWQRPFPLEEFLLPPRGGLDWRVPEYMQQKLLAEHQDSLPLVYAPTGSKIINSPPMKQKLVVWARDQTHNHGKAVYDQYHERIKQETSRFETVFHDAWRMVLTPAPPVARKIEFWMQKLGLISGDYAAVHVRALYGVHNRSLADIQAWTKNAIHCGTQLWPPGPFLFASDSSQAQQFALDYGQQHGVPVVSRLHDTEPLHMDVRYDNATSSLGPSDYYDTFVDLYLLGNARAVAYNVGGYGKLGLIMGFDSKAGIQHQRGGVPWAHGVTGVKLHQCGLRKASTQSADGNPQTLIKRKMPFFVPPMDSPA